MAGVHAHGTLRLQRQSAPGTGQASSASPQSRQLWEGITAVGLTFGDRP
jgi:hypothetical protein